jgi:hypothetical protein
MSNAVPTAAYRIPGILICPLAEWQPARYCTLGAPLPLAPLASSMYTAVACAELCRPEAALVLATLYCIPGI